MTILSKTNTETETKCEDTLRNNNHTKSRHTGIDFLRIVSMLFVCVLHYLNYGKVLASSNFLSPEYVFFWGLESLAFVAVNCFMLISGYFLCNASFKLSRVFKYYAHLLFFSLIGFLIYLIWGRYSMGLMDIRNIFIPISGMWWYASCYFQILLIFPALNFLIDRMTERQHQLLLLMGTIVCSVIPTLLIFQAPNWTEGGSLIWYIFLYFVGAYIKRYDIKINAKKALGFYLISILLLLISNVSIGCITKLIFGKPKASTLFYNYNSIIILISSVCLFLFFAKIQINSKFIKKLAPLVFGVYLFHEHPCVRKWIFDYVANKVYASRPFAWLLYLVVFICFVFIVGCLLDWCFEKIYTLLKVQRFERKIDQTLHHYLER